MACCSVFPLKLKNHKYFSGNNSMKNQVSEKYSQKENFRKETFKD